MGLAGSLCAIQWAVAIRKRRVVAMLNLMGYGERWLIGFPTVQASVLAVSGVLAAVLLAHGSRRMDQPEFRRELRREGGPRASSSRASWCRGAAAVLLLSLLPAIMIGIGFTRVDPSDEIRDV